jgi:DNA ligase-1
MVPARALLFREDDMADDTCILAHPWDGDQDLTGWLLSEKLDGVRALWDPAVGALRSRNDKPLNAPAWFIGQMPPYKLDGELFLGRRRFQELVGIVRKKVPLDGEWAGVAYCVFDGPDLPGGFSDRMRVLARELPFLGGPGPTVVPHEPCEGPGHLKARMDEVVLAGGEGLMARRPDSPYTRGRSWDLLKIKRFQDEEARVVGYEPGKGKHKGRVGALIAEKGNGVKFGIGTGLTDAERENPPPVGSVVTYRFFELTKDGVPRFPSFVAVRDFE